MTFIRRFEVRDAEIYRLYTNERLSQQQIADKLGATRAVVCLALRDYRRRNRIVPPPRGTRPKDYLFPEELPQAPVDDGTAKCRCGLRLPCNNCIPTARDYAESRLEAPPYVRGIDGYRREPKGSAK